MGYRHVNKREELVGFWDREAGSVLEGTYHKFVKGANGSFHIIRAAKPANVTDKDGDNERSLVCAQGDLVAVSNFAAVNDLENCPRGCPLKLVSNGQKPQEKNPSRTYWDVEVYVDDSWDAKGKIPF